jgi:hypothetical protein
MPEVADIKIVQFCSMYWYFVYFNDFSIGFWNCFDSVDFRVVSTGWILELFRQCGFWNCFDSVDFGIVSTVRILELFRQCGF